VPTPSSFSPAQDLQLSVVIPCKNEAENLPILIGEIAAALAGRQLEILVIDDGSTDDTAAAAQRVGQTNGVTVRVLQHDRSSGQSAAVRTGVLHAGGDIIVCTDGDGQNNPAFMPALVDRLLELGPSFGMVGGQRIGRKDTAIKRFASRFANTLRGAMLADKTRDSGCGLKAVRADIFRRCLTSMAGTVSWPHSCCAKAMMLISSMSSTVLDNSASRNTVSLTARSSGSLTCLVSGG
jgi:glycosyltransferase involved in cell wall biosynthesis